MWKSIIALGDSLTSGFQSTQSYGYPSYTPYTDFLQSLLLISGKGVVVLNKGIDGDTTSGMKERFDMSVTPEKPDYVIIWAGINDLYSGVTISEIKSNILDLIKMCIDIPSTPIFCSLTPVIEGSLINDKIRKLNTVISKECINKRIEFVDLYSKTSDQNGFLKEAYSNDGVHLSTRGYKVVAQTVFETIKKFF